jgi:hypothetical protein
LVRLIIYKIIIFLRVVGEEKARSGSIFSNMGAGVEYCSIFKKIACI